MRRRLRAWLLLLPAHALCAQAAGTADIREGLWELSVEAQLDGQPMSSAPMVLRQCVHDQSVQDLMAQIGGGGACQISHFEQTEDRVRWNLACTGAMELSGTGEAELGSDQFSGRMNLVVSVGGQDVPMVQAFRAQRVGECQ